MNGEESFSMRAIWHDESIGQRAVMRCLIQNDHYLLRARWRHFLSWAIDSQASGADEGALLPRLGPCKRQAAAKAPAITAHQTELPMRLDHDGPAVKAAAGRYKLLPHVRLPIT
jgi:hypothetical protein